MRPCFLTHTVEALLCLSRYLLGKEFKYVLLGKFQTDPLEFRFSMYRTMAGSNYHVSIRNLLEGEKKLKLINVLKLVSASKGSILLKDITDPLNEKMSQHELVTNEEYQEFLQVIDNCDPSLTDAQLKALVFVTGYAVSKLLPELQCEDCKALIHTGRELGVEGCMDSNSYLQELDRGGLTWPSELAVACITEAFKVFQSLVANTEIEQKFLKVSNQHKTLYQLSVKRLQSINICTEVCACCSTEAMTLVFKFLRRAVNIFLNNYSKSITDLSVSSKGKGKRKMTTLTKRKM